MTNQLGHIASNQVGFRDCFYLKTRKDSTQSDLSRFGQLFVVVSALIKVFQSHDDLIVFHFAVIFHCQQMNVRRKGVFDERCLTSVVFPVKTVCQT